MTTIRQIVTDGFRESGLIGVGEEPDADQQDEGFRRLSTIYKSLFGHEIGEPLFPVNYGRAGLTNANAVVEDQSDVISASYVPSNVRLMFNINAAKTLYLNPNPKDGARIGVIDNAGNLATYNVILNGNGRKIEDAASVTLATNSLNREWFYRADLGQWVRYVDIDLDEESPLPSEFDDLLVTLLALRINGRYGAVTSPESIEVLKRIRKLFRARYAQVSEQPSELGLYRLPSTYYWSPESGFTRGI